MAEPDMYAVLKRLLSKGVGYSTFIDVGCADGHFALSLISKDLLRGAVPVNVDANPLYENSLKTIADVVGGHYLIGALTDYEGEIEINTGAHHYWASARPKDDKYWKSQHGVTGPSFKVPTTTLDALSRKLELRPPFLLKLDVQGLEESVLKGATEVLKNTNIIICEAAIDEFQGIDKVLMERNFMFYDAVDLFRIADGTLAQFYPIYVKRSLRETLIPASAWTPQSQGNVIEAQVQRRAAILKWNADFLASFKTSQPPTSRNQLCTCGSGRKYKHCCGSYLGSAN